MQQDGGYSIEVDDSRICEELRPGGASEPTEEQEITVPVHEINWHAGFAQVSQPCSHTRVERIAKIVVTGPVLEQIPQDVEGFGLACGTAQELKEDLRDAGACGREMEVGYEGGKGHGAGDGIGVCD
jgi:hypothetical protein